MRPKAARMRPRAAIDQARRPLCSRPGSARPGALRRMDGLLRLGDLHRAHVHGAAVRYPLEIVDERGRIERLIAGVPDREANRDLLAAFHGRLRLEPARGARVIVKVPLREAGALELGGAGGTVRVRLERAATAEA